MEKISILRSLCRSTRLRSHNFRNINNQPNIFHGFRHYTAPSSSSHRRLFFNSITIAAATHHRMFAGSRHPSQDGIGRTRSYCEDATQFPIIRDPGIQKVFKDLIATSWDDVPESLINDAMKALSTNTKDSAGREAMANVLRAAEAVEEFGGILVALRMEIDDIIGMSGEKIGPLSDEHAYALDEVYKRYEEYLEAFAPDEEYLRKKVEIELGAKMIHLKMRCSFLDSQWGKNDEK